VESDGVKQGFVADAALTKPIRSSRTMDDLVGKVIQRFGQHFPQLVGLRVTQYVVEITRRGPPLHIP
jgi:hypothetical protein